MKICLVCPECGNKNWCRRDDGDFECAACGEIVDMGEMPAVVEEDEEKMD